MEHIAHCVRRGRAQGDECGGTVRPVSGRAGRRCADCISGRGPGADAAQRYAVRQGRGRSLRHPVGVQKSMRGSDPDAALHYLARLLEAGDLPSACRRLLVCASEDVGLAYPQIIPIVKAAVDTALMVGLPEAQFPLADAVLLVCNAPKSNSGHNAILAAREDVRAGKAGPIPRQLQNKHFDGADNPVKGQFYKYPHDYPNHWVVQQYLPENLQGTHYYEYGENKTEQAYRAYWERIKNSGNL